MTFPANKTGCDVCGAQLNVRLCGAVGSVACIRVAAASTTLAVQTETAIAQEALRNNTAAASA